MKHVLWDYDIDPYELYEVVTGLRGAVGHFDGPRVFLRMPDRLSWYDLLDVLGIEGLRSRLTPEAIAKLRYPDERERHEYVRRVLQGEALSSAGWDPGTREKVRSTGGLDPVLVHEILRSVPVQELSRVLWSSPVDVQRAKADLAAIADDILYGRGNSVFPGPC